MSAQALSIAILILIVSGCAGLGGGDDPTQDWSASKLYVEAKDELNSGNYEQAISYYETLEARYPFGRFAQQAQLETAYAYYKFGEPDSAIAAADRFIKLNPRHPYADYAYYLKGLTNFNRGAGVLDRITRASRNEVDPSSYRQALDDFSTLIRLFPDSRYAEDAKQRNIYLLNQLARYEIAVADFYLRRQAYVAAVNRATNVIENFDGTEAVADALEVLVKAYRKLGFIELAEDALRVMRLNYPGQAKQLEKT